MPIRDLFCIFFSFHFLLLLTLLKKKKDRTNEEVDNKDKEREDLLSSFGKEKKAPMIDFRNLISNEMKKVVARRWKTRIFCSHNYSNTQRNVVKDLPLKCVCASYLAINICYIKYEMKVMIEFSFEAFLRVKEVRDSSETERERGGEKSNNTKKVLMPSL